MEDRLDEIKKRKEKLAEYYNVNIESKEKGKRIK
jgi:hypothetical protein